MARTRRRPTASGRIAPGDALAFGATLALMSVMVMGLAVNWVAAALLALTVAFYVFVYTVWLKRRTPQNIVIGGAAGAFPPMVGWAAVTGDVSLAPLTLFLIIFMWTPPHFWALALYRCQDYARAGVPMLPVVAGLEKTRQHILGYTATLLPVSLLPWCASASPATSMASRRFGLSAVFLAYAVRLWRDRSPRTATRTFRYSIVYLFGCSGRWWSTRRSASPVPRASSGGSAGEGAMIDRRRRNKNIAIALILAALAALFYLITIVKFMAHAT